MLEEYPGQCGEPDQQELGAEREASEPDSRQDKPRPRWWRKAIDALGNAMGEALFGGDR